MMLTKEQCQKAYKTVGHEGEIPKEDPWGDRYADECSKEEINRWILEGYGMPPIREE